MLRNMYFTLIPPRHVRRHFVIYGFIWLSVLICLNGFLSERCFQHKSGGVLFFLLSTDATGGLEMQLLSGLCVAKDQGLSKF